MVSVTDASGAVRCERSGHTELDLCAGHLFQPSEKQRRIFHEETFMILNNSQMPPETPVCVLE